MTYGQDCGQPQYPPQGYGQQDPQDRRGRRGSVKVGGWRAKAAVLDVSYEQTERMPRP